MRKLKLLLVITVIILAGCQQKAEIKNAAEVIPVRVLKIALGEIGETIDYIGNIKAQDEILLYPKVGGKIVEKLKEAGARVEKGEVIAYIDRDEVGLKFERAPVETPIAGVVGRIYVDIGANVTAQTPVALVVNMDKVKIDLAVPEKHLSRVSLGQQARIGVDAYPNDEFSGNVTKISPVVDKETRAAPIEILVDNQNHRLQSGMFAKVKLIISMHKGVPVILKEAIIGKEPETYVYIVKDNKAALSKIGLGVRQGAYYEVNEGIKEGDLVVVMGQQRLRDGVGVQVEEEGR